MALSDADYAKLLRLNCDHWALRLEFCFLKIELALRAGFNPNQPRAPRGNPDGGQWTGGGGTGSGGSGAGSGQAQLISSRPRSGGTVRIAGRWIEATPAQQLRLELSAARAQAALRRVRQFEPNWRPRPSLHETIEGAIIANESVAREAEARLAEIGLSASKLPLSKVIRPTGPLVGVHTRGAGKEIRTAREMEFDLLLDQLTNHARESAPPSPNYQGQCYTRYDGTMFGVRISRRHGLTIDIFKSPDSTIPRNFKVHKK